MQREYLRFFLRKQEGYYSFYKVAHSLPKSIGHFSMCKYVKVALVDMKIGQVEVEIQMRNQNQQM